MPRGRPTENPPSATQNVRVTSADLIAAATIATIVTAGHEGTRVTTHAVPHVLMTVIMDAIAAARAPKIADETTVVAVTRAADATTAGATAADVSETGIAATAVIPTPWTTSPGPAQGAEMTNHHDGQTRAPTIPPAPERVATAIQFITSTAYMKFTPSTLTTNTQTPLTRKRQQTPKNLPPSPSVSQHARPK